MDFTRIDRHRTLTILGSQKTLRWDINQGTLDLISPTDNQRIFADNSDLNDSYKRMWIDILNNCFENFCTLSEAVKTMRLIDEMESRGYFFERVMI